MTENAGRKLTEAEEIAYAAEGHTIPEVRVLNEDKTETEAEVREVKVAACSNCGSQALHHVLYVAEHGVCVS